MTFLSQRAEQEIIKKVVDAVFRALEVSTENQIRNERILQPKEAAVHADVSVLTLNKWIIEFGLSQAKIGGVVLYDTTDLDEFIAKYKI